MKLLDILCSPWAIVPNRLAEIQEIYFTHLRGEKIDLKKIEAQIGKPLDNEDQGYQIENGVAIIPIDGIIAKRMNMFSKISGGVSTELIGRDFKQALNDPSIESIVFYIDSPGGSVDGTQDLAKMINSARGKKDIIAYTDGMMASAAYWIGSAADKVFISGDTTQLGSIGVVAQHMDISKAEEKMGIKTTEIVAGKYKRIASRYAPLTEDGKTTLQEAVDYIYSVFVNDVATFRSVDIEKALSMADGKVFMGKQAIDAGLADGVMSLPDLIDRYGTPTSPRWTRVAMEDHIKEVCYALSK
jgi:signal peptide peptidase SppA